jgi:hypothetical protein
MLEIVVLYSVCVCQSVSRHLARKDWRKPHVISEDQRSPDAFEARKLSFLGQTKPPRRRIVDLVVGSREPGAGSG